MGRVLSVDDVELVFPTCYGCLAPPPEPYPGCEIDPPDPPDLTGSTNVKLDFALVVDNTGSMGGIISQIQNTLTSLLNTLSTTYEDWRIAVITFKATVEEGNPYDTQILTDFTTVLQTAQDAVNQMEASGGGNEVVIRAVDSAINDLSWRRAEDVSRVIVVVGDEPGIDPDNGQTPAQLVASAEQSDIKISGVYSGGQDVIDFYNSILTPDGVLVSYDAEDLEQRLLDAIGSGTPATIDSITITYSGYARTYELMTGLVRRVQFEGTHILTRTEEDIWSPPVDNFSMPSERFVQPSYEWQESGTGERETHPIDGPHAITILSRLNSFEFNEEFDSIGNVTFEIMVPVADGFVLELIETTAPTEIGIVAGAGSWCLSSESEDKPTGHVSYGEFKGTIVFGQDPPE